MISLLMVHIKDKFQCFTTKDGLPRWLSGKESVCQAGDVGLIPGLRRSLEKEMATHSSIPAWRNPMDRGAWWVTFHGVAKSWT